MVKLKHILSLCFILFSISSLGQEYIFDLMEINVEEGLPHRRNSNIIQDNDGFIWVSTPGVLSRYDGKNFKNFNSYSLNISEYTFCQIACDKNNNIWYKSDAINNQIGIINTSNDSIFSIESYTNRILKNDEIVSFRPSQINPFELFIITNLGMIYKTDGNSYEKIHQIPVPFPNNTFCEEMKDGSLWIFSGDQVILFNNNHTTNYAINEIVDNNSKVEYFTRIVSVEHQFIIESLTIDELNHIKYQYWKIENNNITPYDFENILPSTSKVILINDFICFSDAEYLRIHKKSGELIFKSNNFERSGFTKQMALNKSLFDNNNNLWITTENGILKINIKKNPFTIIQKGNSTRGITRQNEHLLVGGYYGNYSVNLKSGDTTRLFPQYQFAIMSFLALDSTKFLIGTDFNKIIEHGLETDNIELNNSNIHQSMYLPFKCPTTDQIWVGTNKGIVKLNEQTKQFLTFPLLKDYKNNILVRQFHVNDSGIWVVTNIGLFLLDDKMESILNHYQVKSGFPFDNLNHIYEDSDGVFWIGTKGDGLLRWDRAKEEFKQFKVNDGLSNNVIYAVYEDDYQKLWLPSNYGLMCFDKLSQITQVYTSKNGIAHDEFNTFSHFRDDDGTFYFGGIKGITKFHPKDFIDTEREQIPLYITSVRTLEDNKNDFIDRYEQFKSSNSIYLNPADKILEIEFAMLNFDNNDNNFFAYKIEGFHDIWNYTKEQKVSIINLPYGEYTLKIKGRGVSGMWEKNELSIPLTVATPMHLQWWFIVTMILLSISLTLTAFKLRLTKLKKDKERLETEVKNRTSQIEKDRQTIAAQAEKLLELDSAKSKFFSNITHEFRTPLTLILGPIEQLLEDDLTDKQARKLSGVQKNSKYLLQLINQLLDLSKLESGKMNIHSTHGDIVKYTKELIEEIKPLADKKKQVLQFVCKEDVLETNFDKEKWHIIIFNLLSNAIKFTQEFGEIKLELSKKILQNQDCILVKVIDNGIGFPFENIEEVFKRFFQIEQKQNTVEGTGIGLALVKELVELQNGTIKVQSKLDAGSTFTILLPIINAGKAHSNNQSPGPLGNNIYINQISQNQNVSTLKNITSQPDTEKIDLLIVEDNEEMRVFISDCLDNSVYNILQANDGIDGLKIAKDIIPDIILSDVMMPRMDGYELTKNIRSNKETSHIPIILLTAKSSLDSRLEGIENGADVYLSKPFNHRELNLRIKKLLELRQIIQNKFQDINSEKNSDNNSKILVKEDQFLVELKSIVLNNLNNTNFSVEYLSQQVALSRMQLHRKVKALTGKPATDFIRKIRLEHAVTLLKKGNKNISEVAYESGFTSPNYFSTTFKTQYGKSPTEFIQT